MLIDSISEETNHQLNQSKTATAGKKTPQPIKAETVEASPKASEAANTPASEATFAAAAKAKGIKKMALEVAATAGLLRPMSSENPSTSKRSGQGLEELIKTVEDLEKPEKQHTLDLFE